MMGRLALAITVASLAITAAQAGSDPVLVADGRAAFMAQGCYGCHTVGTFGTPIGPDLSGIGGKHGAEYLERWLRDPAAVTGRAHMPKLALTEAEVRALTAFLASLR